jgi:hypothetical protein
MELSNEQKAKNFIFTRIFGRSFGQPDPGL